MITLLRRITRKCLHTDDGEHSWTQSEEGYVCRLCRKKWIT